MTPKQQTRIERELHNRRLDKELAAARGADPDYKPFSWLKNAARTQSKWCASKRLFFEKGVPVANS